MRVLQQKRLEKCCKKRKKTKWNSKLQMYRMRNSICQNKRNSSVLLKASTIPKFKSTKNSSSTFSQCLPTLSATLYTAFKECFVALDTPLKLFFSTKWLQMFFTSFFGSFE